MTPPSSAANESSGDLPEAANFDLGEDPPATHGTSKDKSTGLQWPTPAALIRGFVNALLKITINNKVSRPLIQTVSGLLLIFSLSQTARRSLNSSPGDILLILGLWIAFEGSSLVLSKSSKDGWVANKIFHGPAFGRLGGPWRYEFNFIMAMCTQFTMDIAPEDATAFAILQRHARENFESRYKARYVHQRELDGVGEDQAESEWPEQWDRLQSRSFGGVSFGQSLSGSLVWQSLLPALRFVIPIISPMAALGVAITVWLFGRGLGQMNYLPAIQVAILFGFALSALIFTNLTHKFSPLMIRDPGDAWKNSSKTMSMDELVDTFLNLDKQRDELSPYIGKFLYPTRVAFGDRYVKLIRNLTVRTIGVSLIFYAVVSLVILAASAAVEAVASGESSVDWYCHMALALVTIPCMIVLAVYLSFLILQSAGGLTAIVSAAIILSATPLILGLLFTGEPQGKDVVVPSVIAGVAGALATALADRTRKRVQRSKA
jgi:hypothetical protein